MDLQNMSVKTTKTFLEDDPKPKCLSDDIITTDFSTKTSHVRYSELHQVDLELADLLTEKMSNKIMKTFAVNSHHTAMYLSKYRFPADTRKYLDKELFRKNKSHGYQNRTFILSGSDVTS